jgi:hypothetical protein
MQQGSKKMIQTALSAYMLVIGARNNDVLRQWSKKDRALVDRALTDCGFSAWTYLRAEGRWAGVVEQTRCVIVCGPGRRVSAAADEIAALLQQDSVLVIKMAGAEIRDTRRLKHYDARPAPRLLKSAQVDRG